jgi:hypothetical protein
MGGYHLGVTVIQDKVENLRPERAALAAYYRAKAAECLRLAKAASEGAGRDDWIELANAWTYLALHYEPAAAGSGFQAETRSVILE